MRTNSDSAASLGSPHPQLHIIQVHGGDATHTIVPHPKVYLDPLSRMLQQAARLIVPRLAGSGPEGASYYLIVTRAQHAKVDAVVILPRPEWVVVERQLCCRQS